MKIKVTITNGFIQKYHDVLHDIDRLIIEALCVPPEDLEETPRWHIEPDLPYLMYDKPMKPGKWATIKDGKVVKPDDSE